MIGRLFDPANYVFQLSALPGFATAAAALLLGASVVRRERASRVSLLFLLIPLTIAVWLSAFAVMYCSVDEGVALLWAKLADLGIPFIPAAIYQFTVAAIQAEPRRLAVVRAVWALSALASALFLGTRVFVDGVYHYAWGYYPRYRWPALAYLGFFASALLLSLGEQWIDSRRAHAETHKRRSRSYLVAFSIGSLGSVDYLAAYGVPVYPFGFIPVLVFITLTARTIRRYRLVDITPSLAAPQILATMADPLLVCDAEGTIRLVNPAAHALLGTPGADLVGTPIESLVGAPAGGARAAGGDPRSLRDRVEDGGLLTKAGDRIAVSLSVAPVEEGGVEVGSVLIARDVRERNAAEAALRASEERYRLMFEASPQPMWVYDAATLRFLAVNDAAVLHYGFSREEFLKMSPADISAPEAPPAAGEGPGASPGAAGDGVIRRHRRKDGTLLSVELAAHDMLFGDRRARFVLVNDVTERSRADRVIRESEARFRALAESETAAVFILEGDSVRYVNPALESTTGYSARELRALKFWELAPRGEQDLFRERGLALQRPGAAPLRFEMRVLTRQGAHRWVDVTLTPVEIDSRPSAIATAFDITERRLAEDALRESERRLREILDNMQLISVLLDAQGEVTYCNEFLLDLLGTTEEEVVGQSWFEKFVSEEEREAAKRGFLDKIGTGAIVPHDQSHILTRSGEKRLISWNNTVLRDNEGRVVGSVSIGADITDRKRAEERLRHGAFYDALTGLPNRNLFTDRIASCLARAKRRPQYRFAALFLDIDRFKVVNDSLGHLMGDKLLVEIGRRLEACLRPGDSVARLIGNEFAVLIDDMADGEVPTLVAERIQASLGAPFELAGRQVFLTASIGIAENRARYQGPEDFMRDADTAMHHAKAQGKARHEIFDTAMHDRALGLLQMENDLHRAVEREELAVHYQPIVSVKDGTIVGFEALVRWDRPGHGFVPPQEFIRIAEDTGLIIPMGTWILRQACRQVRGWQEQFPLQAPLMVSVNISPKQFVQPDLVALVSRVTEETGLEPQDLKLEITESALMEDPEAAAAMLGELTARRFRICIDDFGTGYSSLSYLLRFPASTLKIDRSFVTDLSVGSQPSEMVRTVIVLARNLGMDVIAEGVETESQLARLRALGCDYVQGHLISRAVEAAAARALLERERRPSETKPRA